LKERRKHKRSLCLIDVFNQRTSDLIGHVGDIHHEGLNLISKDKIPLFSDLSILLKDPVNKITIPLIIKGLWNRMNENPVYYNTGCQIDEPSPELLCSINDMLEKSKETAERRFTTVPSSSAVNMRHHG